MKKVAITMLITLMLAGCSTPNIQKEPDTGTVEPVSTAENKEQVTKTQEPIIQTATQMPISDSYQPTVDKNWFAGTIGDSKIHAKIEVSDDKVSGVYYYDQYKTNIKLEGYIDDFNEMKEFKTISLTEDTDKRGKIVGRSFGIVNNGSAKTVFKDTTYDEKNENVFFEFKIEDDLLKLNSNMYDYMCGMGVAFDSDYVLGDIEIAMPTALEVGIVQTDEQDKLFKKLVGDKYSDFISYTSYVGYSEVIMDGEKVKAGNSYLRGAYGCCSYIISSKHIYAAIIGDEGIYYYTNDKNYAEKIPEPMAEWAENKIGNIIYNYNE